MEEKKTLEELMIMLVDSIYDEEDQCRYYCNSCNTDYNCHGYEFHKKCYTERNPRGIGEWKKKRT